MRNNGWYFFKAFQKYLVFLSLSGFVAKVSIEYFLNEDMICWGMASRENKIKALEEELRTTKYNKATQHHIGLVKAKLAKLKQEQVAKASVGKAAGIGYGLRKSGDATVALLGFPSVGKSTILNKLTNAKSEVGAYDFTTLTVVPGVLKYRQAKIQILDVPGIVYGAASGKGRGREVLAVLRSSDLILMIVDGFNPQQLAVLQKEVREAGIRFNEKPPDVRVKKTMRDGLKINTTVKLTHITRKTIEGICREFSLINADIVIRSNITDDQLIDVLEGNRVYIPAAFIVNKSDLLDEATTKQVEDMIAPDLLVSADKSQGLEKLKELIFKRLDLIRIYLKEIKKKADMEEPLIMKKGITIRGVCRKLHRDFEKKFRFARLWGPSAKFPGQDMRRLDKKLQDGDVLEIHID